jgi:N-ethylmaleimide reductase
MASGGMGSLFAPTRLGPYTLRNRIVMAPMTRSRAGPERMPSPLAATYYAQRASAGLIITEAAHVAHDGVGYPNTPGIYTEAQAAAWRGVTRAVHEASGRIYVQLWHVGRAGHPSMQPAGELPVAPSPVGWRGRQDAVTGERRIIVPRALERVEIEHVVEQFAGSAELALQAGFDGVDIHAANGYLIDQFLRDATNQRTDQYGGTIPNRARFLLEVFAAVSRVWGPERVGVRVSPLNPHNGMHDSEPESMFAYVAEALGKLGAGYLHVVEPGPGHPKATPEGMHLVRALREAFPGRLVVDGGCDRASAEAARAGFDADLVALATPFIANPDLVERLASGFPLATPDPTAYYRGGERGYVDYPAFAERDHASVPR